MAASDASDTGIGVVILHKFRDGKMKAVTHGSKTLLAAKKNYSQIEKWALAIIFAVKTLHEIEHGRTFFYKWTIVRY